MAKYSFAFKQKLVNEYLQGKTSYEQLVQKYRVSSHTCIEKWVPQYLKNGSHKPSTRTPVENIKGTSQAVSEVCEVGECCLLIIFIIGCNKNIL